MTTAASPMLSEPVAPRTASTVLGTTSRPRARLDSIDLLRGIVMVIMVLLLTRGVCLIVLAWAVSSASHA